MSAAVNLRLISLGAAREPQPVLGGLVAAVFLGQFTSSRAA
jgi:hypothetical protein